MRFQRTHGASGIRVVVAALLLTVGSASTAAAQTPAQKAAAQAMFDQAKDLMKAGDFATACKRLEESQRLDAGMGTQFRLAECYEKSGRLASAWSMYLEVADAARSAGQADRETFARGRASALKPKIASLTIVVSPAVASLSGLHVERDGVAVGPGQWNAPVPVDAGEHLFKATAAGKTPWESKVVVAGSSTTINVTIPSLGDGPKDSTSDLHAPEPPKRSLVPAFVLGGAAVAALGAGGALLGVGAGKKGEAGTLHDQILGDKNACAPGFGNFDTARCPTLKSKLDSAYLLQNIGGVTMAVGGAAAIAAVTYLLLPTSRNKEASPVTVAPVAGREQSGFVVSGSF